ncbi:hypothetical protein [Leptolyngbya sp. FACHB-671]|uniref:hypothetical protein n=1 Tax=Leptolyngbya sp. FACHB-671 TaxID=2692812 RepID=UPI0018F04F60|nr:hypothetical protein [Leptolyngbya sp. FACHB-671]
MTLIQFLDRLPIMLMPKGFLLQPIQASEVANRLVELALSAPAGRVTDIGGPEIWTAGELARAYFKATGRKRSVVEVPIPSKIAQAFRSGTQLCPNQKYGKVGWELFLRQLSQKNSQERQNISSN